MAKIRTPLFSFSASGTIAKRLTQARWKGRQYARNHAAPSNPDTEPQRRSRSTFLSANAIWDAMQALAKAPWDAFAENRTQSGLNGFVGNFMLDNYQQPDLLRMTFSPGTKGAPRPVDIQLTAGSLQITVDFEAPETPDRWTLESAVAATIRDQDPQTLQYRIITVDDFTPGVGQVILTDLTPGVLYVVGAWFTWVTRDKSLAYSPSLPVQSATPLAKYNAAAVRFDGTTTWLDRGAGLTGAFDTPLVLASLWFNLHGGDGVAQAFVQASQARFRINRLASEHLRLQFKRPDNSIIVQWSSVAAFSTTVNPGWHHLLISADLADPLRIQAYLDDAVLPGTITLFAGTRDIDWTASDWGIGGNPGGGLKASVDLSDLYFTPEAPDISVVATRRKFINWLKQPVFLGSGGITPTGTEAIALFDRPTATWQVNQGTGGGFNENGALTDAPTSPSD